LYSTSGSALDVATKDNLWKSLVGREDVAILGEQSGIVKSLAYQHLIGTELGETKVTIQTQTRPPAPAPVQTNQSSSTNIIPTQDVQSAVSALSPSTENHSVVPVARASIEPREDTPHSESAPVQRAASPTENTTPRKRGSGPKPPVRKTSRRWTEKAKHISQEDIDKEEDAKQYAAGLTRVYIDPPGSARPAKSPSPQLPDEPQPSRSKSVKQNVRQKIAVFKSLCLKDPLWLVKKRGSWKKAVDQDTAEFEDRTTAEADIPPLLPVLNGAESRFSTVPAVFESSAQVAEAVESRPVDTIPAILDRPSELPDVEANNHADTSPAAAQPPSSVPNAKDSHQNDESTAVKASTKKRKAESTLDASSINADIQRPRKRGRPRKVAPATTPDLQPEAIDAQIPSVSAATAVQGPVSQQPVPPKVATDSAMGLLKIVPQMQPKSYKSPYLSIDGLQVNTSSQTHLHSKFTSPVPPPSPSTESEQRAQRNVHSDTDRETSRPPIVPRVPGQSAGTFQNIQDPSFVLPPESLTSNDTSTDAAHPLQPSLPSHVQHQLVQPPQGQYLHHDPIEDHMSSQYMAGPPPHLYHEPQLWDTASGHDVPPNLGFQIPTPYAGSLYGSSNTQLPCNEVSEWNGPIQQPQQPLLFQYHSQSSPSGYFGAPPPHPEFPTSTASPRTLPISDKKSQRARERGTALFKTVLPSQAQPSGPLPQAEHDPNYKPKLVAELEAMEEALTRSSAAAEAIQIPDVAARLFVSYNNVLGNLILSGDKTQLKFRALDQALAPLLAMNISQVTANPIVSMKGSRPMELQVKYENESEEQILCRFYIGQSEEAYKAANVMRASIVTARIIRRAANGETDTYELFKEDAVENIDLVKPFRCEKCGKRFKNREGIKYHREKSNTTCNPNFVPPAEPPKPKRIPKRKAQPKAATVKQPAKKKAKMVEFDEDEASDQQDAVRPIPKNEDFSDSVHDSDDSIFEWAEKVAFVNPGEAVRSTPPTPKKAAPKKTGPKAQPPLPEEKILQELLEKVINYTPPDETIDATVENVLREVVDEAVISNGLQEQLPSTPAIAAGQFDGDDAPGQLSVEQINNQRSKDIILSLVNRHFGFFPGENGLWFAFVAFWLRNHSRSGILPTSKLCTTALNQLVQEQKLVSTAFPVRENYSLSATRTFITLPTTALDSPAIDTLKELIKMAYPGYYVPSKFAPTTEVRESLEAFVNGSSVPTTQKRRDYSKSDEVPREDAAYDSDYEYGFEDDQGGQSDENEDAQEDESDRSYYDDGQPRRRSKQSQQQAQRMKSHWAISKATGSNILTKIGKLGSIDLESSPETNSASQTPGGASEESKSLSRFGRPKAKPRAWKTGPITVQEKERRKLMAANKMLNSAPIVLQDEETAAWSQAPYRQPKQIVRTKLFKYRLPEVVTYLQSENGAWTNRARGHGSTPIFSRPQRRADGNPNFPLYLKKIEIGHRPVVPPNPKNRQFLPAAPSKQLLGTSAAKSRKTNYKKRSLEGVEGVEQQNRETKKRTKSIISLPEDVEAAPKRKYRKRKASVALIDAEEDAQSTLDRNPAEDEIYSGPKRRRKIIIRTKREPSVSEDMDPDFRASVGPANDGAPRVTRKAARGGQDLDEIQMLGFFKPRIFSDFETAPNPGLVSLPVSFWFGDQLRAGSKSSAQTVAGLGGINKVALWEQSGPQRAILEHRTKEAGYAWINHTSDAIESSFDTEMMQLKWNASATFKIEDLPYEALDDSDVEVIEAPTVSKSRKAPLKKQKRSGPKKFATRRLTAWPADFDGVLDSLNSVRDELGVEIAPALNPEHGRAIDGAMTSEEEKRLLMAVVVITALTGGVKETCDWVLVSNNFPKYSPNYIRKAWGRLLKSQKDSIQTMTSDFQEAFLSAYEKGELPAIDYDNLVGYDWLKVINWALEKVYRRTRTKISLPNTRKEMKNMYDIKVLDSGVYKARETFFDSKTATYKRIDAISTTAHAYPAQVVPRPKNADDIEIDEVSLARSWIKSVVFTPKNDYDDQVAQEVAKEKMLELGLDLVNEVTTALLEEKVIMHANKGRPVPGRSYQPTDLFFTSLGKHIPEKRFIEAVAFKKFLDAEFASGKKCVRSDYMANDGTIMCVTNLQAHGRILLKGVNVPMNKMGLMSGGYETRKLPKETFRFDMDIYPTESYLFDADIPALHKLELLEPPRGGDAGEIPIWYGVTGKLIPHVWKKILVAVFAVVSLRTGASVASLEKTFRPALEEWEIWRLMEWGVNVGTVKRIDESCEGWTMGEWWWAVVGKSCDVDDEE
jgi:hypothetical protein